MCHSFLSFQWGFIWASILREAVSLSSDVLQPVGHWWPPSFLPWRYCGNRTNDESFVFCSLFPVRSVKVDFKEICILRYHLVLTLCSFRFSPGVLWETPPGRKWGFLRECVSAAVNVSKNVALCLKILWLYSNCLLDFTFTTVSLSIERLIWITLGKYCQVLD